MNNHKTLLLIIINTATTSDKNSKHSIKDAYKNLKYSLQFYNHSNNNENTRWSQKILINTKIIKYSIVLYKKMYWKLFKKIIM